MPSYKKNSTLEQINRMANFYTNRRHFHLNLDEALMEKLQLIYGFLWSRAAKILRAIDVQKR